MGPTLFFDNGFYRISVDGNLLRQASNFGSQDIVAFTIQGSSIQPDFTIAGNQQPGAVLTFTNTTSSTEVIEYEWSAPGADTPSGSGETFSTSFSNPGVYEVTLFARTDEDCAKITKSISIIGVGIQQVEKFGLSIFPNPASDMVTISHNHASVVDLKVYNSIGTLVYSRNKIGNKHQIDVKSFAKGVYLLSFESESEKLVKKLIVK
jgi:hypothetical protein